MDDVFGPRALVVTMCVSIGVGIVFTLPSIASTIAPSLILRDSHIVFCDVGQGDAALIRIRNGVDVLVDAGSSRDVRDCLGRHMPFWDRKIDLAMISHAHLDHYGGFEFVLDSYSIGAVVMNEDVSDAAAYNRLLAKLEEKNVMTHHATAGDTIALGDNAAFYILWPTAGSYRLPKIRNDPNSLSIIALYEEGEFRTLFTGDATPAVLNMLAQADADSSTHVMPVGAHLLHDVHAGAHLLHDVYNPAHPLHDVHADVLKVPHHGSENGLVESFLYAVSPTLSVISVGKENRYDHPSQSIIDMLTAYGEDFLLTSEEGDIVVRVRADGTYIVR